MIIKYQKIWNKVLSTNEKLEYEFSISNRYLIFKLIISIAITLFILLVAFSEPLAIFLVIPALVILLFSIFFYTFYLKVANAYALTDKRIIIHRGWLNTEVVSVDYYKITDIKVREPFLERLITNSGSIAINTAGTHEVEIALNHVDQPYKLKKRLDSIKDRSIK